MLIKFTQKGIFCEDGKFYVDSLRPVDINIITHGHSDHARFGSKYYITHKLTVPILKLRLGNSINVRGVEYGEVININGVKVSLHPAGHIIGSSQVRIEKGGEVAVVAGDYKIEDDNISGKFEPIKCNYFVTESTFALPVFKWRPQDEIFAEVNEWWRTNKEKGLTSILLCYTLGKSQRIIKNVDPDIGDIICHGAVQNINRLFREIGIDLPVTKLISEYNEKKGISGSLVIAPSSVLGTPWLKRFYPYSIGEASGWMQIKGIKRREGLDRGFALSDHADWDGLNWAVRETGAEKVYVTHGYKSIYARWLREAYSIDAEEVKGNWDL